MLNRTLTQYINYIVEDNTYFNNDNKLVYYGDGQGDFEKIAENVNDDLLENYIAYCNSQKKLAVAELKRRQNEQNAREIKE